MPLTYGGGINNFDTVEKLFYSGIEKVSIQDRNFKNFDLINKISKRYGSQSVVMSIDVKSSFFKKKKLYRSSSSKLYDLNLIEFAKKELTMVLEKFYLPLLIMKVL